MLWGRGFRWMYYATGMPGWMRALVMPFGFAPGWGRGFCRWFPWFPRCWWAGIYIPIQWTRYGPQIALQPVQPQVVPYHLYQPLTTPASELEALKQEKEMLLNELKHIKERLKELEGMSEK